MNKMEILQIEIIWNDEDLLEIITKANNGRYSGVVFTYTQDLYLQEFAEKLVVFPKNISDVVIFESQYGMDSSLLNLKFHCIDGVGHTAVLVNMEEKDFSDFRKEKSKASFILECTISQIESFAKQLSKMATDRKGVAHLLSQNAGLKPCNFIARIYYAFFSFSEKNNQANFIRVPIFKPLHFAVQGCLVEQ